MQDEDHRFSPGRGGTPLRGVVLGLAVIAGMARPVAGADDPAKAILEKGDRTTTRPFAFDPPLEHAMRTRALIEQAATVAEGPAPGREVTLNTRIEVRGTETFTRSESGGFEMDTVVKDVTVSRDGRLLTDPETAIFQGVPSKVALSPRGDYLGARNIALYRAAILSRAPEEAYGRLEVHLDDSVIERQWRAAYHHRTGVFVGRQLGPDAMFIFAHSVDVPSFGSQRVYSVGSFVKWEEVGGKALALLRHTFFTSGKDLPPVEGLAESVDAFLSHLGWGALPSEGVPLRGEGISLVDPSLGLVRQRLVIRMSLDLPEGALDAGVALPRSVRVETRMTSEWGR